MMTLEKAWHFYGGSFHIGTHSLGFEDGVFTPQFDVCVCEGEQERETKSLRVCKSTPMVF